MQAMHHAHPLLATLDDHEFADGAWRGGSDEHKPERDGPWAERREAAFRARREWLPQRLPDPAQPDRVWRSVRFGRLADMFLIDTRSRRDQPAAGKAALDPGRTQLGSEQRDWLFGGLEGSTARWRLLANSSVIGQMWAPDTPPELHAGLRSLKLNGADGGPDPDQWDGYPAERAALIERIKDRDVVVLSGDVHVALAVELGDGVAAEFVTASLTSQNLDDKMGWGYRTKSLPVENALRDALNDIRWADLDSHGYVLVDVTPERVQVEHWFVDGVLAPSTGERMAARWEVRPGSAHISRTGGDG
jgi:alkaline phosphatase D